MIIGHDIPYSTLQAALENGSHHGFLLCGPRGIGKALIARQLAVSVLAKASPFPSKTVELQCGAGAYPNFFFIAPIQGDDGKTKSDITIEQIRTLLNSLKQKAAVAGPRIIIIDSLECLSRQAANSLLKMLEEPPLNTFFLNICHNVGGVLATIRSRCLTLNFKPLTDAAMQTVIGPGIDESILELSGGSPGNYAKILQAGGSATVSAMQRLLMQTNLNDLKTSIQELLKHTDDSFLGYILHQFLYNQAVKDPATYAHSTQAVERFLRYSDGTHIDATHRIEAAVLLAQNPSQENLIYG